MSAIPEIHELNIPTELPVYWCSLNEYAIQLALARLAIDEVRITHPDSTPSNVKAVYMSPWKSHTLNDKFTPLAATVAAIAKSIAKEKLKADFEQLNFDLMLTDCWGVIYAGADYTIPHIHFPADFSAVIYLEAGDDCAPIVFGNGIAVKPVPGLLVVFPGILLHSVPENNDNRVVLAMNFNKMPSFKK